MTNKERYSEWAAQLEYVPIYLQPWWMDAVCAGKEWDVLLAEDEEGHIVGALPYLLRKRAWYKYIIMPPMTQIGGIWVAPEVTGDKWKTAEVCRQLKEQLDTLNLAYYHQQFLPGSLCVDALRPLGFKTKERVAYRVNDLSNLDTLIASFAKNKRRQLQKALSLHAERTMDVESFYRFHQQCLKARKHKIDYSREFLLVLERKAHRLGQCQILSICNADGQPYAAAFLVWDKHYLYYFIPALDYAFNDSGAGALLVLEAMKLAREKHVLFDFGPNTSASVARHFAAKPIPCFSVEKNFKWWSFIISWFTKHHS
ncbi:MAG: GNAT family N-acetyltransferase [Paludibacteraceae bacterium]|nr:GNAT family N-acetyltransferase [Paludibacteraceae bacterium]